MIHFISFSKTFILLFAGDLSSVLPQKSFFTLSSASDQRMFFSILFRCK